MSLQNRPQPLSMTHPASLGLPESELSLLAPFFSPEKSGGLADNDGGSTGIGRGAEKEEDALFFSRDVGSFTDITFASQVLSSRMPDGGGSGHVEGAGPVRGVTRKLFKAEGGGGEPETVSARQEEGVVFGHSSKIAAPDKQGALSGEGSRDIGTDVKSTDEDATVLTISEAAAIMHSEPLPDAEENEFAAQPTNNAPPTAPLHGIAEGVAAAFVKRAANSQSWSEDICPTSPVTITPRPSSYTFNMETLPPLLSYDGGEEFSHSPSLNEGGRVMSEEEQVRIKL